MGVGGGGLCYSLAAEEAIYNRVCTIEGNKDLDVDDNGNNNPYHSRHHKRRRIIQEDDLLYMQELLQDRIANGKFVQIGCGLGFV